jgi:hypothetical protein
MFSKKQRIKLLMQTLAFWLLFASVFRAKFKSTIDWSLSTKGLNHVEEQHVTFAIRQKKITNRSEAKIAKQIVAPKISKFIDGKIDFAILASLR